MTSGLEVISHPTGPWLVRAGGVMFAVPARLGQALLVWHGRRPTTAELTGQVAPADTDPEQWSAFMASLAMALDGGGTGGQRLPPPIWLRLPLLPATAVGWLRDRVSPLVSNRGMIGMVLVGLAGYGHLAWAAAANPICLAPVSVGLALGLFFLTALWHEVGHAAAIGRYGYPPGGIGLGLLFVIPVLFADVTAVGVLPRAARVRVDIAGVAFQFGLGGVLAGVGLAGLGLAGSASALLVGAWLALLAVCWSLFPFIRADGYWLVCDLLGVEELTVDPEPPPTGRLRRVLSVYRLANALFLLGVGILLPLRYAQRGASVLGRLGWDITRPALLVPLMLVAGSALGLVWWNILRRVVRLVRLAVRGLGEKWSCAGGASSVE